MSTSPSTTGRKDFLARAGESPAQTAERFAKSNGRHPNEKGVARFAAALSDDDKANACVEAFKPLADAANAMRPTPKFVLTSDEQSDLYELVGLWRDEKITFERILSKVEGFIDSRLSRQGLEDTETMRRITSRCDVSRLEAIDKGTKHETNAGADVHHNRPHGTGAGSTASSAPASSTDHRAEFLADFNATADGEVSQ